MMVQVKITPSITSAIDPKYSDWLTLEREIQDEATVCDLLRSLARSYPSFGKMLFEGETGRVSDEINLVLNHSILETPEVAETRLKNGDTLIVLPVYSGG